MHSSSSSSSSRSEHVNVIEIQQNEPIFGMEEPEDSESDENQNQVNELPP